MKVCIPVWALGDFIRCQVCLQYRRGCSFKGADLGIAVWPKILPTEAGLARRAKAAEKKAVAVAKKRGKKVVVAESSDEGAADPQESVTVATRYKMWARSGVGKQTPPEASSSKLGTFAQPAPPTASSVVGRSYHMFMENMVPFESVLNDGSSSLIMVESARIDLRAMLDRERGDIEYLYGLVRNRRRMGRGLLGRLDDRIAELSEDFYGELSVSPGEEMSVSEGSEGEDMDEDEGVEEEGDVEFEE